MKGIKLWYYKTFKKGFLVKIILYRKDKRIQIHYIKYEGDTIVLKSKGMAYKLESEKIYYDAKGFASIIFVEDEPIGFDILNKTNKSEITSTDLYTGLEQNIVKEIIAFSSGEDKLTTILMMGALAIVGAVGISAYLIFNEIGAMQETLRNYQEILEALRQSSLSGGGGFN